MSLRAPMNSPWRPLWAALAAIALAGCAEPGAERGSRTDTSSVRSPAGPAAPGAARLDSAARRVVAFLRGALPPDSVGLADTVTLRVAPEGGGGEARLPRAALRSPAAWTVPAGRTRYVVAPPAGYTQLTTAVGRHFNCREVDLATRAPAWASAPHVGVRLAPDGAPDGTPGSCLRTWNASLIFDTSVVGGPRLAGVLYDQWEW